MTRERRIAASAVATAVLALGIALPAAAISLSDITGKIQTAVTGNASSAGGTSIGASGSAGASADSAADDGQVCTMDAKQCPDGSYVGRTGPHCSFAACPGEQGASASTSGSGSSGAGVSVGVGGTNVVLMTRGDIQAGAATRVSSAGDVSSQDDLRAYISAEMAADTDVEAVQTSSDTVSITYREPARLLGFIPVSLRATATVDATGDVSIHYPWYGFLYAKSTGDLETALEARVRTLVAASGGAAAGTQLSGSGSTSASTSEGMAADVGADMMAAGSFTAATQAELVAEMRAAMEQAFSTSASADASATASAGSR